MAQQGITFPLTPLPATRFEFSPESMPFLYLRVKANPPLIFGSAEFAAAGEPVKQYLRPGLTYLTFVDHRVIDGRYYYMIEPGAWVRGVDVDINVSPSSFTGLAFHSNPQNRFGWTIYPLQTQSNTSVENPQYTGRFLDRYAVIQVYNTIEIDGIEWHLIGPDEYIQAQHAALVYPADGPPEGVTNGRWIEINLYEQTLAVYDNGRLVYATLTASGLPGWWTRPGLFQITQKVETTPMSGAFEADFSDWYYLEDVPWTMYFDELRALHGAYWHNSFGQQMSHGCANLAPGDAQWIYWWAQIGDWVYVWDPSGETPTDPSLYTEGGA
jgi:hypothetical protein